MDGEKEKTRTTDQTRRDKTKNQKDKRAERIKKNTTRKDEIGGQAASNNVKRKVKGNSETEKKRVR